MSVSCYVSGRTIHCHVFNQYHTRIDGVDGIRVKAKIARLAEAYPELSAEINEFLESLSM